MYYLHYDEVSNCPWRKKCIEIENKNNLGVKPKRKKNTKKQIHSTVVIWNALLKFPRRQEVQTLIIQKVTRVKT